MKKLLREEFTGNSLTRPTMVMATQTALKIMKHEKAVGTDGVPIEVFKALGHEGMVVMINFFTLILHAGKMPDEWRKSTLVPIFKCKGDVQECNSYQCIKLLSHTMNRWKELSGKDCMRK